MRLELLGTQIVMVNHPHVQRHPPHRSQQCLAAIFEPGPMKSPIQLLVSINRRYQGGLLAHHFGSLSGYEDPDDGADHCTNQCALRTEDIPCEQAEFRDRYEDERSGLPCDESPYNVSKKALGSSAKILPWLVPSRGPDSGHCNNNLICQTCQPGVRLTGTPKVPQTAGLCAEGVNRLGSQASGEKGERSCS